MGIAKSIMLIGHKYMVMILFQKFMILIAHKDLKNIGMIYKQSYYISNTLLWKEKSFHWRT